MTQQEKERVYKDNAKKIQYYLMTKGLNADDAEDVSATVFVKFYKSVDERYDGSRSAVTTWLYRITQNTLIDFYRTRKMHSELDETLSYEDKTVDDILTKETLAELGQAMMRLDDRANALVTLVYYDCKKLKEAAEILNMSYSNAKIVLKKSLATIKSVMDSGAFLRAV